MKKIFGISTLFAVFAFSSLGSAQVGGAGGRRVASPDTNAAQSKASRARADGCVERFMARSLGSKASRQKATRR